MIEYSKEYDKAILFISDDKKSGWRDEKGKFLEDLEKEFFIYTGNNIIYCNSKEFYACVGKYCNIQKSSHSDLMLSFITDEYINNINENIYNNIETKIESIAQDYIEFPNIGTEGLDNVYIAEYEFLDCESIENDDNIIVYKLVYRIKIFATSKDFICYDDIDKEDIYTYECD